MIYPWPLGCTVHRARSSRDWLVVMLKGGTRWLISWLLAYFKVKMGIQGPDISWSLSLVTVSFPRALASGGLNSFAKPWASHTSASLHALSPALQRHTCFQHEPGVITAVHIIHHHPTDSVHPCSRVMWAPSQPVPICSPHRSKGCLSKAQISIVLPLLDTFL